VLCGGDELEARTGYLFAFVRAAGMPGCGRVARHRAKTSFIARDEIWAGLALPAFLKG
jgi:hypothetical protein